MNAKGELEPGDVFKTATGDVWYVEDVSPSGAYCVGLAAHPTPITTRKRVTKMVNRHLRNTVFALRSVVDLVDPSQLNWAAINRRRKMARKEGGVAEAEAPATEVRAPRVPTVAGKYELTDKAPEKELRGQGKETYDAMKAAGKPVTVKEIADACVFAGSRQDKERVAGFYVSQYKKKGYVRALPVEPPA